MKDRLVFALGENRYYPFGLVMSGISSKAAGSLVNKRGFQGKELQSKEFSDGSGLELYDFGARQHDPQIGRWTSVDPLASKFYRWSPYVAMGDNPIRKIDPDGKKFLNFDENGNYTGTTKDNRWHNFWHGSKGRVLDGKGDVTQKFRFADPKQDVKDIQSGVINKLVFVKESEISSMVAKSGAFTAANKTENNTTADRYKYIKQEGVGGGKLDFSYTAIPTTYPGASTQPLTTPSSMMFLVGNVAHNHMNFGNFLFGAAGQALGHSLLELSVGAHYNSVKNPGSNGYSRQLDSNDDQFSIKSGFVFANNRNYDKVSYNGSVIVGDLQKVSRMPDETSEH
jgi:RHS repeat-associated protein